MPAKILKFWHQWSPVFHVLGLMFLAGVAWAGVTQQSARIDKLETQTRDMPATLARIDQEVQDMHEWMRATRYGNAH